MKLVITGAAGHIGSRFVELYGQNYDLLLTDLGPPYVVGVDRRWRFGDICDAQFLESVFGDAEAVLHLAANPAYPAPLERLYRPNILGAAQVFQSAYRAGVRRLVFASSVHAVLGYGPERPVRPEWPARPVSLYGATKVFGEALCRAYAKAGMSCLAIRIGAFSPVPVDPARCQGEGARQFVSHEDLCQLLDLALRAPDSLRFGIFHGLSDNAEKRLDITSTIETLGYAPAHGTGRSQEWAAPDQCGV